MLAQAYVECLILPRVAFYCTVIQPALPNGGVGLGRALVAPTVVASDDGRAYTSIGEGLHRIAARDNWIFTS